MTTVSIPADRIFDDNVAGIVDKIDVVAVPPDHAVGALAAR